VSEALGLEGNATTNVHSQAGTVHAMIRKKPCMGLWIVQLSSSNVIGQFPMLPIGVAVGSTVVCGVSRTGATYFYCYVHLFPWQCRLFPWECRLLGNCCT